MLIRKLMEGHDRFKRKFEEDRAAFVRLADHGQKPTMLWIGCSDSRVVPEQITGAAPGEIFVIRNIANMVPPSSSSGMAVGAAIEYAVLHLQVSHIVVCGHTECGGIRALLNGIDVSREPHVARWIELARPAQVQAGALGLSEQAEYLETIKANVLLQRAALHTYDCVQSATSAGRLKTHAWLYDLHSGDLLAHDATLEEWGRLVPSEEDL